jgi:hypothetical protein
MKKEHKERKGRRVTQPSRRKEQHPADWVPIQVPPHFEQMYQNWVECEEPNIGWCMLCDEPIRSANDLIPGTNTHTCAAGRELEVKIRLVEVAASNRKHPEQPAKRRSSPDSFASSSAQEPRVGIFSFFFDGKLIVDSTPLSQAEQYANALTHPKGHPRSWAKWQTSGLVPADIEYDEIPRGRVAKDTFHDQFIVFRDRCIPMKAIRQIISRMHLPKDTTIVAFDPRYRCPRCMKNVGGS